MSVGVVGTGGVHVPEGVVPGGGGGGDGGGDTVLGG